MVTDFNNSARNTQRWKNTSVQQNVAMEKKDVPPLLHTVHRNYLKIDLKPKDKS